MTNQNNWKQLNIYLTEGDRWQYKQLYLTLVEEARTFTIPHDPSSDRSSGKSSATSLFHQSNVNGLPVPMV
jgi:hypothetical protein